LSESKLWDLLREAKRVKSTIEIQMNGASWLLFHYISIPKINLSRDGISYQKDHGMSIRFESLESLEGDYQILLMDQNEKIVHQENLDRLRPKMFIPVELSPGKYTLEITANQNSISIIENIVVEHQNIDITDFNKLAIKKGERPEKNQLFQAFTLAPTLLKNIQNKGEQLIPILKQLIAINNRETWISEQPLEDGFLNSLPAWAVTRYPMRFVSIAHNNVFHVFPERLVFGGIAGQGAIDLKISGYKVRTYVAWKPSKRATIADMWVSFPKDDITSRYSEVDPLNSWPGYRCLDCGEIVGHKQGTYHNFPPSIINAHLHRKKEIATNQFADTVYSLNHRLIVRTDFYEDELLNQTYSPREIIGNIESINHEAIGELNIPISGFSSFDFEKAWLEFTQNIQSQKTKLSINELENQARLFTLSKFLLSDQSYVPFSPYQRLVKFSNSESDNLKLVNFILSLSMILRTKAHNKTKYTSIINSEYITEYDLVEWTYLAYSSCPKLLEWAMSWAEIFFVHSVS
jgi:hypothetical protein